MMAATTTAVAKREQSLVDFSEEKAAGANVLAPALIATTDAPYLRVRKVRVDIDPDPEHGEVYPAIGRKGMLSHAKPSLAKLAEAAGFDNSQIRSEKLDPESCRKCMDVAKAIGKPVQCPGCPSEFDVSYRAVVARRTESGYRAVEGTREFVWADEVDDIIANEAKRYDDARKKEPADVYIARRKREVRKQRFSNTETKAWERAVRLALGLRGAYTEKEMAQAFYVVRVELAPELIQGDPDLKAAVIQRALTAGSQLFGVPRVTPRVTNVESVVDELQAAPDFDKIPKDVPIDVDPETGEITDPADPGPPPEDDDLSKLPTCPKCSVLFVRVEGQGEHVGKVWYKCPECKQQVTERHWEGQRAKLEGGGA